MSAEDHRRRLQLAALQEHATAVEQAAVALRRSLAKCGQTGIKADYTLDELDDFEALSARFARTSDLYTQKLLKSLLIVLREDAVSFLDKARLAEQLGIIESAEDLAAIRDLRNTIAHEYAATSLDAVFQNTLRLTGTLLAVIGSTLRYATQQGAMPPTGDRESRGA